MSVRTLRMGGWILLAAAVLSIVSTILGFVIPGPAGPNGPSSNIVSVVSIITGILLLVGLAAAYMAQSKSLGTLGLIGLIALLLTTLLFDIVLSILQIIVISTMPTSSFSGGPPPFLFVLFIVGTLLEVIGGVLLGLRIIQTHVYPVLSGWLLIAGVVLSAIDFPLQGTISMVVNIVSTILVFAALGWIGFVVGTRAEEAVLPPVGSVPGGISQ